MDKSTLNDDHKKRPRGRPATGKTPMVGLRLPDDLKQAADTWGAQQTPPLGRSKAIRAILMEFLKRHGLLK